MRVQVGRMPGVAKTVVVPNGATVAQVLKVAKMSAKGFRLEVDDRSATVNSRVRNNSLVLLTKNIKGN